MLLVLHHFWGHILESAAESLSFLFIHIALGVCLYVAANSPAEVANLYLVVLIDEQIFRFEVPREIDNNYTKFKIDLSGVDYVVLVKEVNARNCLNEVPEGLIFGETLFFGNFLKKILLWNELHH